MKVQRNQPCPCNSGKKAKRCCHSPKAIREAREERELMEFRLRELRRKEKEIENYGRELTPVERKQKAREAFTALGLWTKYLS